MKKLNYVVVALLVLFSSCEKAVPADSYGAALTDIDASTFESVKAELESKDSVYVKIESTINATCKMKGCWMTIQASDEEEVRVTFKDYGFFVPKEGVENKEVVFEGWAYKKVTPVNELKHFAEDEGKSEAEIAAITAPQEEISFVANGVEILKN